MKIFFPQLIDIEVCQPQLHHNASVSLMMGKVNITQFFFLNSSSVHMIPDVIAKGEEIWKTMEQI